ncbi:uncharacterized protein V1518DRAFT_413671 [Limtongia smithiae]|uniref:uncharacterized protein n=1 Tax=Limtongia smithiae TaxID=1125753 RepID=UPI0034CDEC25
MSASPTFFAMAHTPSYSSRSSVSSSTAESPISSASSSPAADLYLHNRLFLCSQPLAPIAPQSDCAGIYYYGADGESLSSDAFSPPLDASADDIRQECIMSAVPPPSTHSAAPQTMPYFYAPTGFMSAATVMPVSPGLPTPPPSADIPSVYAASATAPSAGLVSQPAYGMPPSYVPQYMTAMPMAQEMYYPAPPQMPIARPKRKRFRLTHAQTRFLVAEFAKQPHHDAALRERLAAQIPGLTTRQLQVWFQNRRARLRLMKINEERRQAEKQREQEEQERTKREEQERTERELHENKHLKQELPSTADLYMSPADEASAPSSIGDHQADLLHMLDIQHTLTRSTQSYYTPASRSPYYTPVDVNQ